MNRERLKRKEKKVQSKQCLKIFIRIRLVIEVRNFKNDHGHDQEEKLVIKFKVTFKKF